MPSQLLWDTKPEPPIKPELRTAPRPELAGIQKQVFAEMLGGFRESMKRAGRPPWLS